MRFIITTGRLPGVGLSLEGHFGGIRYPDDAAAVAAARAHAKGEAYTIERERGRR